jgi:hypothetical protein
MPSAAPQRKAGRENHPYALAAQVSAAVLLAERGELAAAEELETKTVGRLSEALGESHPDALRGRANLLLTRAEMGNEAAAEWRYRRSPACPERRVPASGSSAPVRDQP